MGQIYYIPLAKAQLGRRTYQACSPGQHSHFDYNGGKCHPITQAHIITRNFDTSSPNYAVAVDIRNKVMLLSQQMSMNPYFRQCFIYINEVLRKPDDKQAWGKFYNTLKVAVKHSPKRPDLVMLLKQVSQVKV